jgi:hypothetical protein
VKAPWSAHRDGEREHIAIRDAGIESDSVVNEMNPLLVHNDDQDRPLPEVSTP